MMNRYAGCCAVLLALCAAVPVHAGTGVSADSSADAGADPGAEPGSDETGDRVHGSWWWSWGNGVFGINFGGVSYGDSAKRVEGSDKLVHQLRAVSGFHGIELRGPIDVVLRQGGTEKVTVHTDDNIAPLIETNVVDGILRIGVQQGAAFRTKHHLGITVDAKQISTIRLSGSGDLRCAGLDAELLELTLQGSGDVRIDNLKVPTLAVLLQGSGNVNLAGTAAKQGFVLEGSGDIEAGELGGRDVGVKLVGSGDARVWASDALTIELAGSGDVRYRGQPKLTKNQHGSGDIVHE